jgi:16S rRNA processing protein RimM
VGRILRAHGLKGELVTHVLTDFPERFRPGSRLFWTREADERTLTITGSRAQGKRLLLSFEGIETLESAVSLAGGELSVPSEEAVVPPPGFFYSHEIEHWPCEDSARTPLGSARRLEKTAAGPMLVLVNPAGREVLVPFAWPIVVSVDRAGRRIVLDPPEGLLEL